jgi:protein SCO1/2
MIRFLAVLLVVLGFSLASCEKAAPLNKKYKLPPFSVTERSGQPFTLESMRGKVWVADFFYATCPGICKEMNQRLSYVRYQTAALPDVRYLSISTQEADTPEVLREYAKRDYVRADERWFFVTGKSADIYRLSVDGFKLALEEPIGVDTEKREIIHATRLVLIDREGWIRGYYEGIGDNQTKELKRLIDDIKRVSGEPYSAPPPTQPSPTPAATPVAQAAAKP